jgi:hypothetical protein
VNALMDRIIVVAGVPPLPGKTGEKLPSAPLSGTRALCPSANSAQPFIRHSARLGSTSFHPPMAKKVGAPDYGLGLESIYLVGATNDSDERLRISRSFTQLFRNVECFRRLEITASVLQLCSNRESLRGHSRTYTHENVNPRFVYGSAFGKILSPQTRKPLPIFRSSANSPGISGFQNSRTPTIIY